MANLTARKSAHDKHKSLFSVLSRYTFVSCLFWVCLTSLFILFWYDPSFGENSQFTVFYSFSFFMNCLIVFFIVLVISIFFGFICSSPAIILKLILKMKLKKRSRRGQKPVLLIFFTRYLPILCLIFCNYFFLILNFSSSPNLMKQHFNSNSFVYKFFFIDNFFYPRRNENLIFKQWEEVANSTKKESAYVFFIPVKEMQNENSYKLTKSMFLFKQKIILDTDSKPDIIWSIAYGDETRSRFLNSPLHIINYRIKNLDNDLYIGAEPKNIFELEPVYGGNILNSGFKTSWFSMYLNRIANSVPNLMFTFRSGISGYLFDAWKWNNLSADNYDLLINYSKEILDKKLKKNINIFFMHDGYETKKTFMKNFEVNYLDKKPYNTEHDMSDFYLYKSIQGIKNSGVKKIFLVPFANQVSGIIFSDIYMNSKSFNEIHFYSELLRKNILNNTNHFKEELRCKVNQWESIFPKVKSNNFNFLTTKIIQTDADKPVLRDAYLLMIKNLLNPSVICIKGEQDVFMISKKTNSRNIGSTEKEEYESIYSRIFSVFEGRKKNDSEFKIQPFKMIEDETETQNFESQGNENKATIKKIKDEVFSFFKQFEIYKKNRDIQTMKHTERDLFLKDYGKKIMEKIYLYAQDDLR